MKKIALFILFIYTAVITLAQNKVIETVDYTPYCGTWQYVNGDTTLTVSFKVATIKTHYSPTKTVTKKQLVGGYRLTVKGKFDDNYLILSKIPSELNQKIPSEPNFEGSNPSNSVYVKAFGIKGAKELECQIFKNRKYDYLSGFSLKILSPGKMLWHWNQKEANMLSEVLREAKYIGIPGHAIMTKIK